MEKVKVTVIGAGAMANNVHYPSLNAIEDAEITAICDTDRTKMEETAKKYKIQNTYTDYKQMLEKESPDAVYVIMPPHHLYDIVIYCLRAGIPTFIEKPPGITTVQTKNMANLAERKGVITMAGFQRRFAPLMAEAKKKIIERGKMTQCRATFFKNNFPAEHPYYNGAIDILRCDAIHAVDTLRWMGGEPVKIASTVKNLFTYYPNSFNALLEFKNGCVGSLSTNFASGTRIYSVEMHGKGISAFVDPEKQAYVYKDGEKEAEILNAKDLSKSEELFKFAGFFDENKHFIKSVRENALPETNFADAVKTMELADKIYNSTI
jgi:virulence factor